MKFISTIHEYLNEQNRKFWDWFGDSKITENGKALVCYHGTNDKDIKNFDFSKIGSNKGNYGHYGYGIYFSTDIREAKTYGDIIYQCYIKMTNPFTGSDEQLIELKNNGIDWIDDLIVLSIDFTSFKNSFKKEPHIFKFIADVEKFGLEKAWDNVDRTLDLEKLNDISDLIEYTTLNKDVDGVANYVFDELKKLDIDPKLNMGFPYHQSLHWITDLGNRSKEVTDVIKKLGYDGVWYGSEVVAFEPNQIKSINNDGSWDITDSNIYS